MQNSAQSASVSVVIPFYNHAECLENTLASVRDQAYPVFECVVVNDGSSAEQSEKLDTILSEFRRHFAITRLDQENAGPGLARYNGAGIAKGDYIAFLDADDIWYPSKLAYQIPAMLADSADCSLHDSDVSDDNGRVNFLQPNSRYINADKDYSVRNILTAAVVNFTSTLVIRNHPAIVGYLNQPLRFREDHYFLIVMLLHFNTPAYSGVHCRRVIDTAALPAAAMQAEYDGYMAFYNVMLQTGYITSLQYRMLRGGSMRNYARKFARLSLLTGLTRHMATFLFWPVMYLGSKFHNWLFYHLPFPARMGGFRNDSSLLIMAKTSK
jgi:glycosyltransferase involved in cell wall biosynthesis